jgi:hypothetical protein
MIILRENRMLTEQENLEENLRIEGWRPCVKDVADCL